MLLLLLRALREYFADTDDPTPGGAFVGPTETPTRDNERLYRIFARVLVELAQNQRQQAQDIAAIKAKLGL